MNALSRLVSFLCLGCYSVFAQAVSEISISAAHVEHAMGDAKDIALKVRLNQPKPTVTLHAALKPAKAHAQSKPEDWVQFDLTCDLPKNLNTVEAHCINGRLKGTRVDLPFNLEVNRLFNHHQLDLNAAFHLKGGRFSDEAGLHAAEKLNGTLTIALKREALGWQWQTSLDWQTGEVFWQPFYIESGGHTVVASGTLKDDMLHVNNAHLKINRVGELDADGVIRLSDAKLLDLNATLPKLNLSAAYPLLFKPLLGNTAFNNATIEGDAALALKMKNAELQSFALKLNHVDIVDINNKFAFYQLNANIPWSYEASNPVRLSYDHGSLLNLPLGKTEINAEVNRFSLTSPHIRLPMLDGALSLSNVSAARIRDEWYWHLSAKLEPISMSDFTTQLKLPRMLGKASAVIPLVTYSGGILTTDGSVVLNVFNGTATVTQLTMDTPLGIAPKLNAEIALRNLDLGELTRTFSFGAIEGKLDGDIKALALQNWKPVTFDAMLQSSPGKYPKKISQRAVENISSLGGSGAAAAVQRSFLRFFEQFNYGKMGLSCRLRNDICEMGGIESTAHGYIIVKGSGIPAITVMGYNQTVGWSDLLARVKHVTDGNSKAVIK
ncbi:hypothetical protein [Methylotenera sp.]|uniref:hypothetical protein n=1 Tax=Methylotenera sp. TaxID=2051956 RepID=UPI0027325374|nr:hypothetical protein [Methylotenera sp.]MDP3776002.1 hypothetical protein [Methylotenera sp.]